MLVSVTSTGTGGGDGNSTAATISSNGQFIAFASEAGDLVNGDVNGASDVFVRDLVSGTTRLISRSFQGNVLMDNSPSSISPLSGNPLITSDGRFVFFESRAAEISYGIDANNAVGCFPVRSALE
jgi:Tol biopolymer transport system component